MNRREWFGKLFGMAAEAEALKAPEPLIIKPATDGEIATLHAERKSPFFDPVLTDIASKYLIGEKKYLQENWSIPKPKKETPSLDEFLNEDLLKFYNENHTFTISPKIKTHFVKKTMNDLLEQEMEKVIEDAVAKALDDDPGVPVIKSEGPRKKFKRIARA